MEYKGVYRVKLTLSLISSALLLFLIAECILTSFDYIEIALITVLSLMFLLFLWLNEDTIQVVNALIIWSCTILIFYLSWLNNGIFDSAIYAYPCVILLAMFMGTKMLFVPLIISIFLQLLALTSAHELNLIHADSANFTNHNLRTIHLSIICLFFCLITYFFIKRFQESLEELKLEKSICLSLLAENEQLLKYDHLSKLPNEHICTEQMSVYLGSNADGHHNVYFMVLDIVNLREINNSFGHKIGDQLIIEITERLNLILQNNEYFYRFRGNEFVLTKISVGSKEFEVFKERVLQAIIAEFTVGEYSIAVHCAIGIAISPFDGNSIESLRANAHLALQYGKAEQKNSVQYYQPSIKALVDDKYFYVTALKNAILKKQFTINYQPKVNLQTNKVIGVEALIRWHHPDKGWLPPDQFIPIAEESGLIIDITKLLIKQACQDCMIWQNLGYNNIRVAINLSAVDFKRGNLPKIIFNTLNHTGMSPHLLELEITESTIFDDVEHIQAQIRKIQKKGVSFAIDDFGTGYSNLGYLNKFNVSVLKIDRSFISKISDLEHEQHIVNAIIMMSKSLGIQNVAEGIEDAETAQWLRDAGCQIGQGYLWAEPLPLDDFIEYLKNENQHE